MVWSLKIFSSFASVIKHNCVPSFCTHKGCDNEIKEMEPARKPPNFVKDLREKNQEDRNKSKGKGRVTFNDLDPMDPASYSDIPRYLNNQI